MKSLDPIAIERINFRSVKKADLPFLLDVYQSSREIELSMMPWNAEQKRAFIEQQFNAQSIYYLEEYPEATHNIVLFDGNSVGRIYVNREPSKIAILDFAILPLHRKIGIGTAIVKSLQFEAAQKECVITVYVETFNPSQNLFRSLGFQAIGEEGVNLLFEWKAEKTT